MEVLLPDCMQLSHLGYWYLLVRHSLIFLVDPNHKRILEGEAEELNNQISSLKDDERGLQERVGEIRIKLGVFDHEKVCVNFYGLVRI